MISYIKGILSETSAEGTAVETGNIGNEIRVPLSALERGPGLGGEGRV